MTDRAKGCVIAVTLSVLFWIALAALVWRLV
jgi:hypothetical protein